ncbi:MAG TPA: sulfite exporter TauE/SafE family protein, partial [Limnochordales bacterium]
MGAVARLLLLALVGAVAQFVDGAMGMAYGMSSASLMLLAGMAPAAVSATVHLAELPTTLLSGWSHWQFGNLRPALALAIAVPGAAGAWMGARLLAGLPAHLARPLVGAVLCALGAYILWRFARSGPAAGTAARTPRPRQRPGSTNCLRLRAVARTLLAFAAGFVDAAGGGGWGPLMTSGFLAGSRREVRRVVAAVDAAEFAVTAAASAGLLRHAPSPVEPLWVAALVVGGAAAAPAAAWLVGRLPSRLAGTLVGGLVL